MGSHKGPFHPARFAVSLLKVLLVNLAICGLFLYFNDGNLPQQFHKVQGGLIPPPFMHRHKNNDKRYWYR